jgi:quinol monooxygenase YgiN/uncharacterized protein YunC (DUF1805 family)
MMPPKETADTIVATLRAKPGSESQLEARLNELATQTSRERSVRIYAVHRNVQIDTEFVVYERYADIGGLEAHLASEHLQRALKECEPLLAGPPNMAQCRALFGLPYQRTLIDGFPVETYVITIGGVALTFSRAKHGLVTCGAILPGALEAFGIASARVRPSTGSIGSLEELLVAQVVEHNDRASAFGVAVGLTGREALRRLGQEE